MARNPSASLDMPNLAMMENFIYSADPIVDAIVPDSCDLDTVDFDLLDGMEEMHYEARKNFDRALYMELNNADENSSKGVVIEQRKSVVDTLNDMMDKYVIKPNNATSRMGSNLQKLAPINMQSFNTQVGDILERFPHQAEANIMDPILPNIMDPVQPNIMGLVQLNNMNPVETNNMNAAQPMFACPNVIIEETNVDYNGQNLPNLQHPQVKIAVANGQRTVNNTDVQRVQNVLNTIDFSALTRTVAAKVAATFNGPAHQQPAEMIQPIAEFSLGKQGEVQQVRKGAVCEEDERLNLLRSELGSMLKFGAPRASNQAQSSDMHQAKRTPATLETYSTTQQVNWNSGYNNKAHPSTESEVPKPRTFPLSDQHIAAVLCKRPGLRIVTTHDQLDGSLFVRINDGREFIVKLESTGNEHVKKVVYVPGNKLPTSDVFRFQIPTGTINQNGIQGLPIPVVTPPHNRYTSMQIGNRAANASNSERDAIPIATRAATVTNGYELASSISNSTGVHVVAQPSHILGNAAPLLSILSEQPKMALAEDPIEYEPIPLEPGVEIEVPSQYTADSLQSSIPVVTMVEGAQASTSTGVELQDESFVMISPTEEEEVEEQVIIFESTSEEENASQNYAVPCTAGNAEIIRVVIGNSDEDEEPKDRLPIDNRSINIKKTPRANTTKKCFPKPPRRKSAVPRKPRTSFTDRQLRGLLQAFDTYPDQKLHLAMLSEKLKLPEKVIDIWYMNHRAKLKREEEKMSEDEDED